MNISSNFTTNITTYNTSEPHQTVPNNNTYTAAYVLQEYFYNQLPIYYFLIAGIIRYIKIKDKPIKITEEQHEKQKYNKAIASYLVKKQLSNLIAILYIGSVTLSLVIPQSWNLYFGASHKWGAIIYFLGALVWYFSRKVLEIEYFRELPQALYSHRIFWPFSACFQIICIFQEYKGPLNIIMNTAKAIPESLLLFYAIYKPYDDIQQYIENQQDLPTFARMFIEKFESNRIVLYLLNIQSSPNEIELPLISQNNAQMNKELDISQLQKYIPQSQQQKYNQVQQERYLFNKLPRSAIAINQKIVIRYEEDGQKRFYYHIITQIGQNKYDSQQNYQDILNLEEELSEIYKYVKPKKFPEIEKIKIKQQENQQQFLTRRISVLEIWLKSLFKEPLFVHENLLEFLNVDETAQYPYITYFKLVANTNPQFSLLRNQNFVQSSQHPNLNYNSGGNLSGSQQLENNSTFRQSQDTSTKPQKQDQFFDAIEQRKDDMEFEVSCDFFEKGQYGIWEFVFNIQYFSENYQNEPLIWRVNKTFEQVKQLNQKLEIELKSQISIYHKNLIRLEKRKNDNHSLQQKKEALNLYIKTIFNNKFYWTKSLFYFVEFDPITEEHKPFSQFQTPRSSYQSSRRSSFKQSQFED